MLDVLRGYLQVANGLGEITVQRARDLAEAIATQSLQLGSRSSEQVQTLTDELLETANTNRDLLAGLVRTEVDRAVGRMGFVREDELAAVRQHVHRLEEQMRKEQQRAADRATGVVLGAAETSTLAAKSALDTLDTASKTVSGVASKTVSDMADIVREIADAAAPSAAQPSSARRGAAKLGTAKGSSAKSGTSKSGTAKSSASEPPAVKPSAERAPVKPAARKRAAAKSAVSAADGAPAGKAEAVTKKSAAKKSAAASGGAQ